MVYKIVSRFMWLLVAVFGLFVMGASGMAGMAGLTVPVVGWAFELPDALFFVGGIVMLLMGLFKAIVAP